MRRTKATFRTAEMLGMGKGTEVDNREAFRLLKIASAKKEYCRYWGSSSSLHSRVHWSCPKSFHHQKNDEKAEQYKEKYVEFLKRDAKNGSAHANLNLGRIYERGDYGETEDLEIALYQYEEGVSELISMANSGNYEAQYKLYNLYRRGKAFLPKSEEKANIWLEKSVSGGYPPAILENGSDRTAENQEEIYLALADKTMLKQWSR